jgi:hypothetical protein
MKTVLRAVITYAAVIAVLALLISLARRAPRINTVIVGLVLVFLVLGSLAKLGRVARHGDYSVTSNVFWLPRRWRAWMVPQDLKGSDLRAGRPVWSIAEHSRLPVPKIEAPSQDTDS